MQVDRRGLVPPDDLNIQFGGGGYLAVGDKMRGLLERWCGLEPGHRVLDVGCGAGRVAAGLAGWLEETGEYHGFDTYPFGIEWCSEAYAGLPNFHFCVSDVHNTMYNPFSETRASEYVFPYGDGYFDIVVLRSVFTHMFPDEMLNYTEQMARVMRPGARAMVTFFLQSDDSLEWQERTGKGPRFKKFGLFYTEDTAEPLDCVGYDEPFVRRMFLKAGLVLDEIRYGNWCGRKAGVYQDYALLHKPASGERKET